MKIEYGLYGDFTFSAEDARDRLWLSEFVENIDSGFKPILSNFIRVDMESMCVVNGDDGKNQPAVDVDLEECVKDGDVWGAIESVSFDPFGYYMQEEAVKRTEQVLSNISNPKL